MQKQDEKRKRNIPMYLAGVLFCLTVISICLISGLYAKYISRDSGSDSARVAAFQVTESATSFEETLLVEVVPGTISKEIKVSNDSEVAIHYTITITNKTKNIPLRFKIAEGEAESADVDSGVGVIYSMEPDTEENYTLYVIWSEEGATKYAGMVDLLEISLVAEQID